METCVKILIIIVWLINHDYREEMLLRDKLVIVKQIWIILICTTFNNGKIRSFNCTTRVCHRHVLQ